MKCGEISGLRAWVGSKNWGGGGVLERTRPKDRV